MPWNLSLLPRCWNAQTLETEGRALSAVLWVSQIFPKTDIHCVWSWAAQAKIPSGKCSDTCDPSSLNCVLELGDFQPSVIWWFWVYVWKAKAFLSAQVYQEWEWLQTSGNRHYQQRSKRGKMLFILLQAKKACQGRSWGIHTWIYTLGTPCTVLRPVQELTCIRHKTKCMEPHLGFCD